MKKGKDKMNDSNKKDFLSIGEFADFAGITIPALRHYDNIGVFQPAKHGIELKNKYRYYSPTQITIVKMIRVLVEIGVPLTTIKELSTERSPEKLLKLLNKNKAIIADEIHFLQEVYTIINTFMDLLYEGISVTETVVTVSEMPEKRIILGDKTEFTGETSFIGEFKRFCCTPHKPRLNMSFPIGGFWESMAAFFDEPSRPVRFFSLDPNGLEKKETGLYLVGYTRGYYGQTNDLPERMAAFAKGNGLVFSGPVYNLYLFDEMCVNDPEHYLLQVSASVMETRRVFSRRPHRQY
jgi:DNA-binding transcriptional MerR regulator